MSFVCMAVTMVLFISLFLYFRQKIVALEEKIALLSEVTTTMAGITTLQQTPTSVVKTNIVCTESEDESESENSEENDNYSDDSDTRSDESVEVEELYESPVMNFFKVNSDIKNVIVMNESTPKLDICVEHLMTTINMEEVAPVVLEEVAPVVLEEVAPVVLEEVAPVVLEEVAPVVLEEVAPVVLEEVVPVGIDVDLPKRIVSNDDVKTLVLDSPYDAMTLKELKEKVAELNGPKLKTKKELLEYLKNKM